ncbi:MAG: site-specific DNA-methyltransferase [Gemmatimonadota bacterium]
MSTLFRGKTPKNVAYQTGLGRMVIGKTEDVLHQPQGKRLRGKVNLIFTSPPFPLNRKKKYGNETGTAFIEWLSGFAPLFRDLLSPDGSVVIEMGNAWEPGSPTMSTLALESLLAFKRAGDFYLCQEFIWYNPARLPSPAEWVTVRRVRVKDSFTRLWWLSPVENPKASNRRVLQPYSGAMKDLLRTGKYNSGLRPSEHGIGRSSFLTDNGGSIPANVLVIPNTRSSGDAYQRYCRERRIPFHPARMPIELAEFFINFLTTPGDLVLDPFGGSNTTGAAAESLQRQWMSIEPTLSYALGSAGRFQQTSLLDGLSNTRL